MTQLELPQLSLARYYDLLKRRKWQVVPVSVLGLMVGAVVAFFIPRYYVASTEVRYNAELQVADRSLDDPLSELLANAQRLVPATVPAALARLGWPEAMVDDPDARAAFEAEVRSRTSIQDIGNSTRGRVNTILRITYRDTDGQRAADFVNTLAELWMGRQIADIERGLRGERDELQRERIGLTSQLDLLDANLSALQRDFRLDPINPGDPRAEERGINGEIQELSRQDIQLESELTRMEAELEAVRTRIEEGSVREYVDVPTQLPTDPLRLAEAQSLLVKIKNLERVTEEVLRETAPNYQSLLAQLEKARADFARLVPQQSQERRRNPAYIELEQRAEALDHQREGVLAQRALLRGRIDELERRGGELAVRAAEFRSRRDDRERLSNEILALNNRLRALDDRSRRLTNPDTRPFSVIGDGARVPPRPTDPNITVVALIGSALGLALAIGLILLTDALRFTFKTIEDLERGLPVPVLGGVSHLETTSQRRELRRGRLVLVVVFATLLVLVVALVTIYYVVPARLPAPVRDVLDMLLGSDV